MTLNKPHSGINVSNINVILESLHAYGGCAGNVSGSQNCAVLLKRPLLIVILRIPVPTWLGTAYFVQRLHSTNNEWDAGGRRPIFGVKLEPRETKCPKLFTFYDQMWILELKINFLWVFNAILSDKSYPISMPCPVTNIDVRTDWSIPISGALAVFKAMIHTKLITARY